MFPLKYYVTIRRHLQKRLILGAYVSEANLLTSPIGETKCLEEEAAYAALHCIEAHLDQKQITSEKNSVPLQYLSSTKV